MRLLFTLLTTLSVAGCLVDGAQTENTGGLSPIISNPTMPEVQALAVCKPQAELAKTQARSAEELKSSGSNNSIRCNGYGNNIRCNSSRISGGFAEGFAEGLSKGMAGRKAYRAVLDSCLALYGWRD